MVFNCLSPKKNLQSLLLCWPSLQERGRRRWSRSQRRGRRRRSQRGSCSQFAV